jgi:hypothetical protein
MDLHELESYRLRWRHAIVEYEESVVRELPARVITQRRMWSEWYRREFQSAFERELGSMPTAAECLGQVPAVAQKHRAGVTRRSLRRALHLSRGSDRELSGA